MSVLTLKCQYCGGDIEINSDESIGTCRFCDSKIVIPKNSEKRAGLFNRANYLRQNNEFDRAIDVYEDILKEDNTDAVAHWELTLCKYGIEYVEDPRTRKMFPVLHRTHYKLILQDDDYKAAIQYSDAEARTIYEAEAKKIETIQRKYIEIARNEEAYDVFICYKESDDDTQSRTEDSVIAQDIYHQLCKKGYKVFFARKTLEQKLGMEYEPIIFAALNSAKVMVALGTKKEHFEAVWVKNEWSRYLELVANDSSRLLIPAYKNFSPYELPDELQSLQSLDMSKVGFIQDLFDGIDKIIRHNNVVENDENKNHSTDVNSIQSLLRRGESFLKLENYTEAEKIYNTMTEYYPENYEGWWGLILSGTSGFTDDAVDLNLLNKYRNVYFGYIMKLADEKSFNDMWERFEAYYNQVCEKRMWEQAREKSKNVLHNIQNQINQLGTMIQKEQNNIAGLNSSIKYKTEQMNYGLNQINNQMNQVIKNGNVGVGNTTKTIIVLIVIIIFYGAMSLIGGVLIGCGLQEDISGLVITGGIIIAFFLAMTIRSIKKEVDSRKNRKNQMNAELSMLEKKKRTFENQNKLDINGMKRNIDILQDKISGYQTLLQDKQNFAKIGFDGLAVYYYAEIGVDFGYQMEKNPVIQEAEERAMVEISDESQP